MLQIGDRAPDFRGRAATGVRRAPPGELVVALHCSGVNEKQWRALADTLGAGYVLVAPEHYGSEQAGPWTGERAFTLADEAERTIALLDHAARQVHLVGHSYGGGVALHVALARPHRVASLSLYEPAAFHLLRGMGAPAAAALAEITAVRAATTRRVLDGDLRGAAAGFVDYWSGDAAWAALGPDHQATLTRWAPKAPLDFAAALGETTPADAYRQLQVPVLLMRGELAPAPSRLIVERLAALLPEVRTVVVPGAGHMGPFTHRAEVNARIAALIAAHAARARMPVEPPLRYAR